MTSLDFERLLCATGPHEGEILRPSDHKHPHKIAWIHCVGSRQVLEGGHSYCSSVCCSYIQKQVILAKDHDADTEAVIFHNDIRSFGKDFERFYRRAENLPGVRFIRSYVEVGREIPETKNVTIRYATDAEGVKEEEFDLVVLGVGLAPPANVERLAEQFGIELNEHGFCKTNPVNPIETTRPGVFVSGAFQGPMDIPESVMSASGANALAGALLKSRRGKLDTERVYPEERDVSEEEVKVGVFACHCGANIGRVVDIPSLVEYAKTPGPRRPRRRGSLHLLHRRGRADREHDPGEGAQPRGGGRLHPPDPRAALPRHPPGRRDQPVLLRHGQHPGALLLGPLQAEGRGHPEGQGHRPHVGGPDDRPGAAGGVRAARQQGGPGGRRRRGRDEQRAGPGQPGVRGPPGGEGGGAGRHGAADPDHAGGAGRPGLPEGPDPPGLPAPADPRVPRGDHHGRVGLRRQLRHHGGSRKDRSRRSTTAPSSSPRGRTSTGPPSTSTARTSGCWTQLELEERIAGEDEGLANARSLVMIQCVGCRQEGRDYCARVCCSQAVKNALALKARNPEMDIYILYRDMRTYGFKEDYYREAAEQGVRFVRWEPEGRPEVEAAKDEEGKPVLRVTVPDAILGQRLALDADLVVLSAAVVPSAGNPEIARLFKVPVNPDGFFQEAHVKLRPVDFAADGVFMCGANHYPKHLSEAISQAYGAAGRAVTLLSHDTVTASGSVCEVEESACIACGACIAACTYDAIHWRETQGGQEGRGESRPLQGGRSLLRQVPDRRHRPEALHQRGGLQPDRRGAFGIVELMSRTQAPLPDPFCDERR